MKETSNSIGFFFELLSSIGFGLELKLEQRFPYCDSVSDFFLVLEMDKLNFVKNGVLRLPPGFRFHPTDEELVFQYLKRKIFACPLPASIIPDFDVCKSDPWDLPGNSGNLNSSNYSKFCVVDCHLKLCFNSILK